MRHRRGAGGVGRRQDHGLVVMFQIKHTFSRLIDRFCMVIYRRGRHAHDNSPEVRQRFLESCARGYADNVIRSAQRAGESALSREQLVDDYIRQKSPQTHALAHAGRAR